LATPAKKTKPAPSTSRALANWDEEMAKAAAAAAKMEEGAAGGQFFSVKGGQLTFADAPIRGNQIAAIIVDHVLENVFYQGTYDPDTPQSPSCFAFGRDEKTMAPHKIVIEAGQQECGASGLCHGCERNEFGSAETGKGKACRNTRRLALLSAGSFNEQSGKFELMDDAEEALASASFAFLKLPVTSVKGYASFVQQLATTMKRPPFGIITKIKVVPDAKTQFKVVFEPLMNVPDELMPTVIKRHQEAEGVIEFPYRLDDPNEAPAPRGKVGKTPPPARQSPPARGAAPARGRRY